MYDEWAELYKTLGDPTRLHILGLLGVRDACVCELVELLPISQSAVSQHLRRLKSSGLVRDYRDKAWVFYSLKPDMPGVVATFLKDLPIPPEDAQWLRSHQVGQTCQTPMVDS